MSRLGSSPPNPIAPRELRWRLTNSVRARLPSCHRRVRQSVWRYKVPTSELLGGAQDSHIHSNRSACFQDAVTKRGRLCARLSAAREAPKSCRGSRVHGLRDLVLGGPVTVLQLSPAKMVGVVEGGNLAGAAGDCTQSPAAFLSRHQSTGR